MGIPIIGEIINAAKDIVSEVVVDKDKKMEANLKLRELEDRYAARIHEEVIAQTEVNKVEAAHSSIFVAGWRPAAGWVGAAGLAISTVVLPLGSWVANVYGYAGSFPEVDTELLVLVLGGMLGLGGLCTFEKVKGVERETITEPGTMRTQPTTVDVSAEGEVSVQTGPTATAETKKKKKKFKIF